MSSRSSDTMETIHSVTMETFFGVMMELSYSGSSVNGSANEIKLK